MIREIERLRDWDSWLMVSCIHETYTYIWNYIGIMLALNTTHRMWRIFSTRKHYLSRNEMINIAILLFLSCFASQDSLLLSGTIFSIFWCKSRQFSFDFQIDCKINFVSLYYTLFIFEFIVCFSSESLMELNDLQHLVVYDLFR